MKDKTLVLRICLDKPTDNIRSMFIELPSGYGDINIDRPNQRALLSGICQGFGVLFGCAGATLLDAYIVDTMINPPEDDCEECRFSGLTSED